VRYITIVYLFIYLFTYAKFDDSCFSYAGDMIAGVEIEKMGL